MFKKLTAFIILFCSFNAIAGGDRVGNGGDVVVCKNSVELLDIYEAKLNGHPLLNPNGQNYKEKLRNLLIDKMFPMQPTRTTWYLSYLESFESEAAFLPGIILNDVDDAGMVAIPKGCKLKQIIIQLSDSERPPGKKRYTVSLDLWNKLDDFNKMSLALHEIVYREAISYQASNSMIVRAFVGEILRSDFDLMNFFDLDKVFSHSVEYQNIRVNGGSDLNISLEKNEYQEDVMKFESDHAFIANYNNENLNLHSLTMRMSDMKILNGLYDKELRYQFMRAKETYELRPATFFTTSYDLDYANSNFKSKKPFIMIVAFRKEKIFSMVFSDVSNFNYGSYREGYFSGNFNLDYMGLSFTSLKKNYLYIDPQSGEVQSYLMGAGHAQFTHEFGIFNCSSYEYIKNSNYPYYNFKNCNGPETVFKFPLASRVVEATLQSHTDQLLFAPDRLISDSAMLSFATKVYLGRNDSEEEVYINPGVYEYRNSQSGYTLIIDSQGHSYELSNGRVTESNIL